MSGIFYGVGVGPGDPELMTRKAERILREVDWVFFPREGTQGKSFVASILAPLGLAPEKLRGVSLCMSRDRRADNTTYSRAADEIVEELQRGQSAAWVTEGDPLFFSTFFHLHEEVRRRLPQGRVEIVPGVSSMHAATALAGVPSAVLDDKIAVLPATYGLEELEGLLASFATVFLVKVHLVFDQILDLLASLPEPVNAWYLEKIGTPQARVVTDLESLRGQEVPYFSLIILKGRKMSDVRSPMSDVKSPKSNSDIEDKVPGIFDIGHRTSDTGHF